MIVNWTNHLNEVITNHNSVTLEFEQVIIKTLSADINFAVNVNGELVRDGVLDSSISIDGISAAVLSRERCDSSPLTISGSVSPSSSKHRSLITEVLYLTGLSQMIKSELTRARHLTSLFGNDLSVTSTQSRERGNNVSSIFSLSIIVMQTRYRLIKAANSAKSNVQSRIKKYIGYWQTIMTKIKE